MNTKLVHKCFKYLSLSLLLLAIIGTEPVLRSAIFYSPHIGQNLKLAIDTRAQVELNHKRKIQENHQKIIRALDQVAIGLSSEEKCQMAQHIYKESQEYNIDPRLIVAMIKTESEFQKGARSRAGAHGLMQVRIPTAQEVAQETGMEWQGRKSLYNPKLNIKMGTYYFDKMIKRFDNVELALTAYNMGPTALRKRMSSKRRVPKRYSKKVLSVYKTL